VKYNVCTEEADYIMGMILQVLLGPKFTSELAMWLMNTIQQYLPLKLKLGLFVPFLFLCEENVIIQLYSK
jgi:hypothetical protein